jgi:hypothetical protein
MKGIRESGAAGRTGARDGQAASWRNDKASPERGRVHTPILTVQCPNRACGNAYTVEARFAGRQTKCPECRAVIVIPSGPRPASVPSPKPQGKRPGRSAHADNEPPPQSKAATIPQARVGCIGRGNAGKTALFRALGEGLVGDFLPSGLHVDASDPREAARLIREAEEMQRLLQETGLPPTQRPSQVRYYLYEGDRPRAAYELCEVIGQVLTHTLPDSKPDQQARYADYLKSLVNTQVLWAVVPCMPPDPAPRDRRRYANDLRITLAYLREALRLRSIKQPVAVALVLSKVDALFSTAAEARAALSDDNLRTALGPLVQLVEKSARVSDAAIIPVSAFGYGNAVLHAEGGATDGRPPMPDEPFGGEPVWLLREGASPQPANLDTLFLWTLLFGLLNQADGDLLQEPSELGAICRTLYADLEAAGPWLVPLKGGIEGGQAGLTKARA